MAGNQGEPGGGSPVEKALADTIIAFANVALYSAYTCFGLGSITILLWLYSSWYSYLFSLGILPVVSWAGAVMGALVALALAVALGARLTAIVMAKPPAGAPRAALPPIFRGGWRPKSEGPRGQPPRTGSAINPPGQPRPSTSAEHRPAMPAGALAPDEEALQKMRPSAAEMRAGRALP